MPVIDILPILIAGLLILQTIWFLTDPRPFKERPIIYIDKAYLFQVFLLIPQIVSGIYFPFSFGQFNLLVTCLGLVIFVFGIFISIWAKFTMKRYWGMPAQHDTKRQNKLVTSGPFAFSRNPIYLGLLLVTLGFALSLRSYFIFLVILHYFYFYQAVRKEEKILEKVFGKEYLEYKKQVPRFLLLK